MLKKVSLPYRDMCICVCTNTQQPVPNENTISLLHTHFIGRLHLAQKSSERAAFGSRPVIPARGRLAITWSNLGRDRGFVFLNLEDKRQCLPYWVVQKDEIRSSRHS